MGETHDGWALHATILLLLVGLIVPSHASEAAANTVEVKNADGECVSGKRNVDFHYTTKKGKVYNDASYLAVYPYDEYMKTVDPKMGESSGYPKPKEGLTVSDKPYKQDVGDFSVNLREGKYMVILAQYHSTWTAKQITTSQDLKAFQPFNVTCLGRAGASQSKKSSKSHLFLEGGGDDTCDAHSKRHVEFKYQVAQGWIWNDASLLAIYTESEWERNKEMWKAKGEIPYPDNKQYPGRFTADPFDATHSGWGLKLKEGGYVAMLAQYRGFFKYVVKPADVRDEIHFSIHCVNKPGETVVSDTSSAPSEAPEKSDIGDADSQKPPHPAMSSSSSGSESESSSASSNADALDVCSAVSTAERKECGHYGIKEGECLAKGCCWKPLDHNSKEPWCFEKPATGGETGGETTATADDIAATTTAGADASLRKIPSLSDFGCSSLNNGQKCGDDGSQRCMTTKVQADQCKRNPKCEVTKPGGFFEFGVCDTKADGGGSSSAPDNSERYAWDTRAKRCRDKKSGRFVKSDLCKKPTEGESSSAPDVPPSTTSPSPEPKDATTSPDSPLSDTTSAPPTPTPTPTPDPINTTTAPATTNPDTTTTPDDVTVPGTIEEDDKSLAFVKTLVRAAEAMVKGDTSTVAMEGKALQQLLEQSKSEFGPLKEAVEKMMSPSLSSADMAGIISATRDSTREVVEALHCGGDSKAGQASAAQHLKREAAMTKQYLMARSKQRKALL